MFCLFTLGRHGNFTAGVTSEQPDLLCTALALNIELLSIIVCAVLETSYQNLPYCTLSYFLSIFFHTVHYLIFYSYSSIMYTILHFIRTIPYCTLSYIISVPFHSVHYLTFYPYSSILYTILTSIPTLPYCTLS